MLNPLRKLAFAASLGAGIASFATVASALPVFDAMAIRNAAPPIVEEVQWRWGWGWGWGARRQTKLASGLLIENTMRHGNHLGSRAWVSWARAVVQQDHVKIDLIKRVSLMLRDWTAEITRDEIQRRSRRQYSWQLIAT
jgi:hypothetical protein